MCGGRNTTHYERRRSAGRENDMTKSPSQNKRFWASRSTLLLAPLLLSLAGCDWGGTQTLPGQMVGEWRTDEPRYHGRFIKLEADRVTFGLGGLGPDKA